MMTTTTKMLVLAGAALMMACACVSAEGYYPPDHEPGYYPPHSGSYPPVHSGPYPSKPSYYGGHKPTSYGGYGPHNPPHKPYYFSKEFLEHEAKKYVGISKISDIDIFNPILKVALKKLKESHYYDHGKGGYHSSGEYYGKGHGEYYGKGHDGRKLLQTDDSGDSEETMQFPALQANDMDFGSTRVEMKSLENVAAKIYYKWYHRNSEIFQCTCSCHATEHSIGCISFLFDKYGEKLFHYGPNPWLSYPYVKAGVVQSVYKPKDYYTFEGKSTFSVATFTLKIAKYYYTHGGCYGYYGYGSTKSEESVKSNPLYCKLAKILAFLPTTYTFTSHLSPHKPGGEYKSETILTSEMPILPYFNLHVTSKTGKTTCEVPYHNKKLGYKCAKYCKYYGYDLDYKCPYLKHPYHRSSKPSKHDS